ncbi:MAG: arginine deiminase-related protein [Planctomycetota bacterium]|jgi:N-dimethylarginine dimethylaminohydrolase|nr:arginine deiminase-related protein [Planctomycetota bacterium]
MSIITFATQWDKTVRDYQATDDHLHVLMGAPDFFTVAEGHNNHMYDENGNLQQIDLATAKKQWQQIHDSFCSAGIKVDVLEGRPGLADLVFTANPSFVLPFHKHVWRGQMAHQSRRSETEIHINYFQQRGYQIFNLDDSTIRFEGHGDSGWHPRRYLLHAAVGQRTELAAWEQINAAYPDLDILLYELQNPDFYHLDTALAALDETTALVVESAFSDASLELINQAFPDAIYLNEFEAYNFAGNAFCPDTKNVFIEQGCDDLKSKLAAKNFCMHELATQQFRMSGGSVFCMKQSF